MSPRAGFQGPARTAATDAAARSTFPGRFAAYRRRSPSITLLTIALLIVFSCRFPPALAGHRPGRQAQGGVTGRFVLRFAEEVHDQAHRRPGDGPARCQSADSEIELRVRPASQA